MHIKLKLLITLSSVLLTTCTFYDQRAVISPNGLSCQSQINVASFEAQGEKNRFYILKRVSKCSYQCPDGKFREFEIPEKFSTASPMYSGSKQELDSQFCGTTLQPSPTQTLTIVSPTSTVFPTVIPTPPPTGKASSSPTASSQPPLLQGDVTMCDLASNLINFRMVEPVPDLADKALDVQIADQQSSCAINPVNTSLLTCTIPPSVTFPTRIVVRLDGAVVNDFTFNGQGCAKIATPFPTRTP